MTFTSDPAVAAIQFALETDEGIPFLHCWNEGNFDAIRREWPEAPESVFIGADPMHPETRALLDRTSYLDTTYCQHPHCQTTGGCQGPCSKKPAEPTPSQIRRARLRADPVKAAALDRAKERIAAELANSTDPVKGPSDSAIMFEWSQTPNTGDMRVDLIAFARALLARYGQYT